MDLTLSPSEVTLRDEVYGTLKSLSAGATSVPAGTFQQALKFHNLTFGTDIVDRIMLVCKINDMGQVCTNTMLPCAAPPHLPSSLRRLTLPRWRKTCWCAGLPLPLALQGGRPVRPW